MTLLSLLINFYVVYVWSLYDFLYIRSSHLRIEIILLLPFQFGCLSFLLVGLIAEGRTLSTMLNKSGESEQSCLAPDLKGNTFSFSPLSMLAVGVSYVGFTKLRYVPSISTLLSFYYNWH